jgi:hypothetical protein
MKMEVQFAENNKSFNAAFEESSSVFAADIGEVQTIHGKDGYTPQKGVDYWTDADKAEIVAAVIAALPVYGGEVEPV